MHELHRMFHNSHYDSKMNELKIQYNRAKLNKNKIEMRNIENKMNTLFLYY